MSLIGRNEHCHCGSGKKYKKCCLRIDEDKLKKGEIPLALSRTVKMTSHDIAFGIKELALAQLEQNIMELSAKHIKDNTIIFNSQDLIKLAIAKDQLKHYLAVNQEVMEIQGGYNIIHELNNIRKRAETRPSLTNNECLILNTVARSCVDEYSLLSDTSTADYSAMKILNEFAYQTLKLGVPDDRTIWGATIVVDTDSSNKEKLINWELLYDEDGEEPFQEEIWIDWVALDELNDEYQKYSHSLHGLEEESKKDLATVMYQESSIPEKSRDRVSFIGMVTVYTGILERELRLIVGLNEGNTYSELMMKKINDYFKINELPYLSENIENLYDKLEEIRKIRNKAAHGDKDVSYEDFCLVKKLLIDDQLLEFISWAKIYYEDSEGLYVKNS